MNKSDRREIFNACLFFGLLFAVVYLWTAYIHADIKVQVNEAVKQEFKEHYPFK